MPVGLGALDDGGFSKVGEPIDRKVRAQLLDESLEILTGLWSGEPFSYSGQHYRIEEMTFLPPPVQKPRIPVWVVGAWPSRKSMGRALRYDGVLAAAVGGGPESPGVTPETIREIKEYVKENREGATAFDIVWEGQTPGEDPGRAASIVRPFAEAGRHLVDRIPLDASQRAGGSRRPHRTRGEGQPPRLASWTACQAKRKPCALTCCKVRGYPRTCSPTGIFEDLEDLFDQGLAFVGGEVAGMDGLFI